MLMIIFNTAKSSTTFGYKNEIFMKIRFVSVLHFLFPIKNYIEFR